MFIITDGYQFDNVGFACELIGRAFRTAHHTPRLICHMLLKSLEKIVDSNHADVARQPDDKNQLFMKPSRT
jgi:hypothetical protein